MTWCRGNDRNPVSSTLDLLPPGDSPSEGAVRRDNTAAVKRQTVLGLVVPGALILTAGALCCPFIFLVGVALVAFGFLLLVLLPAAAWQLFKSLPEDPVEVIPQPKKPTQPQHQAGSIGYTNAAFDPKESLEHVFHSPSIASAQQPSTCSRCRLPIVTIELSQNVDSNLAPSSISQKQVQDSGYHDLPPRYSAVIRESPLI
ncbi:uncharacterized protein LOC135398135 [Ornithodoros turicata]|uniref:uncharacterized protein LOC135398135 n=1 Tax=Ornithodoros turicata TaxID=34597 RepID=UPI0031399A8C